MRHLVVVSRSGRAKFYFLRRDLAVLAACASILHAIASKRRAFPWRLARETLRGFSCVPCPLCGCVQKQPIAIEFQFAGVTSGTFAGVASLFLQIREAVIFLV